MSINDFFEISIQDKDYLDSSGIGFHTFPQTHPANFLDKADFVGRFENFEQDFKKICELNNIKFTSLPHWNKTKRLDYRSYFDDKLLEKVSNYYSQDLIQLNYNF
jgi:Icc-related predicted phosphoesterase